MKHGFFLATATALATVLATVLALPALASSWDQCKIQALILDTAKPRDVDTPGYNEVVDLQIEIIASEWVDGFTGPWYKCGFERKQSLPVTIPVLDRNTLPDIRKGRSAYFLYSYFSSPGPDGPVETIQWKFLPK